MRGRRSLQTQPCLQPLIPGIIARKQRAQDFDYSFSEAARCKSLWIRKVTEHRIAHVHTYNTRAADTESESKRVTGSDERARIRIHYNQKKPVHPGHPIKSYNSQIQAFLYFINLSHSSRTEVLTRGLIGTCARCIPFKNVTTAAKYNLVHTHCGCLNVVPRSKKVTRLNTRTQHGARTRK